MTLSRRQILVSILALAALAGIAMSPQLLGSRVGSALDTLGGADQGWLFAAAVGFAGAFGCTVVRLARRLRGRRRSDLAAHGDRGSRDRVARERVRARQAR